MIGFSGNIFKNILKVKKKLNVKNNLFNLAVQTISRALHV